MSEPKNISIEDYNYALPNDCIAKFPLQKRDESKLLIYRNGEISQKIFKQITEVVPSATTLVFNNTKVIYARLVFHKESGARIEIFCLEPIEPADYAQSFAQTQKVVWKCMVGNLRKWKGGALHKVVKIGNDEVNFVAEMIESNGLDNVIQFSWDDERFAFSEILENIGELPIPPYLNRETCENDKITYQTVYSKIKGSVAAPTAGLHFTQEVLDNLKKNNVACCELTLHVGAGTFHPVKSNTIGGHNMHTEMISVKKSLIEHLIANFGHVFAVGTTSVRTLESLYYVGQKLETNQNAEMCDLNVTQWEPYDENSNKISTEKSLQNIVDFLNRKDLDSLQIHTQIIIVPSFKFRIVSGIITNFHQPKSTLLLLVSAFVGNDWQKIYDYALSNDFRFLSYGDSSILMR